VVGRKLSEEQADAEDRAAEAERKLADLTSQINNVIHTEITEALASYSAEQTINTVS